MSKMLQCMPSRKNKSILRHANIIIVSGVIVSQRSDSIFGSFYRKLWPKVDTTDTVSCPHLFVALGCGYDYC